jgi:uncharacterized membrane protein YhdT
LKRLSYEEKFKLMDKEAHATLICALLITVFFWLAIWLLKDFHVTLFKMPLWFTISCIGGYLVAVVGVIVLVRYFMYNFDLDKDEENAD